MSDYVISLDMDGVVYPFVETFNPLYMEKTGETLQFNTWLDFSSLPGEIITSIWRDPRLFLTGEPYPGAVNMVQGLLEIPGVEVFFVTSPGRDIDITVPSKWAWINRWFPNFPASHFVTTQRKQYFRASLMIEDYPTNIVSWLSYNPTSEAILIPHPWNEDRHAEMRNLGVNIMDLDRVLPYVYNSAD